MANDKATPQPWASDGLGADGWTGIFSKAAAPAGSRVALVRKVPDAELVLQAVNAHEALVEALEAFVAYAVHGRLCPLRQGGDCMCGVAERVNRGVLALEKARGAEA